MKRKRASKEPPAPLTLPAVLRASRGDYFVCALGGVIALVMLPGSLLGAVVLGFGRPPSPSVLGGLVFLCGLLFFGGCVCVWEVCNLGLTRVTLTTDAVESKGPLRTWRLGRADIRGYRVQPRGGVARPVIKFELESLGRRKTYASILFEPQRFEQWLDGLTNLDEHDFGTAHEALLTHHRLGSDRGTQERRLRRHGVFAFATFILGVVTTLWIVFWPHPRVPLMIAALSAPIVGFILTLATGGVLTFSNAKIEARPSLLGFLIPGAAMGGRLFFERIVIDSFEAIPLALAVAAVAIALAWVADRKMPAQIVLLWGAAFALPWTYGAVSALDVLLDHAAPDHVMATVTDKKETYTRYHTAHEVMLQAEDDSEIGRPVDDEAMYRGVEIGDRVCVVLHPGAFGYRWREVEPLKACGVRKPA